jgi:hypothetical protein
LRNVLPGIFTVRFNFRADPHNLLEEKWDSIRSTILPETHRSPDFAPVVFPRLLNDHE